MLLQLHGVIKTQGPTSRKHRNGYISDSQLRLSRQHVGQRFPAGFQLLRTDVQDNASAGLP